MAHSIKAIHAQPREGLSQGKFPELGCFGVLDEQPPSHPRIAKLRSLLQLELPEAGGNAPLSGGGPASPPRSAGAP